MPEGVRFTRPSGGLFLWVELPGNVSARVLLEECVRRDVAFVPGGAFYPNGGHENTLRLNFSNMPVERIREGVRRLASALEEVTRRKPMAGAVREEEPALVSQA
jgi:2-aminoadipate transaminase